MTIVTFITSIIIMVLLVGILTVGLLAFAVWDILWSEDYKKKEDECRRQEKEKDREV